MTVAARKNIDLSKASASTTKAEHMAAVGDLSDTHLFINRVLVVTYIRSEKTPSGLLIRPQKNIDEDEWQGKVGLIAKVGPLAFDDPEMFPWKAGVGDWVLYRVGDGIGLQINGAACRILRDENIIKTVKNPEIYF